MDSEDRPVPSVAAHGVLLRSFMLIAGTFVANLSILAGVLWLISVTLFPEAYAIINGEPDQFQQVLETEPERIFPLAMLWLLLVVNAMVCCLSGWLVARLAPIGKFQHAIFFAAILFVQYLQFAISAHDPLQTMLVLFMGVSPVATLLGANFCLRCDSG